MDSGFSPAGCPGMTGSGLLGRFRCAVLPSLHRESGVSSTPRLLDSITGGSGILDRPPSLAMTAVGVARVETVMRAVSDWGPSLRGATRHLPSLRAKRSNPWSHAKKEWIASSLSLLAMTLPNFFQNKTPRSRGAMRPRFCPRNQRAQGMPGAQCTRSLACEIKKHTSIVTTVTPERPGIPRAMVLRLTSRSPR
jgi:hypothetical protein